VSCLLLYLQTGKKINLSRFMNLNFKLVESEFEKAGVLLLGEEPYKMRNLIQRKYHFG
jgi:hypothetical protein